MAEVSPKRFGRASNQEIDDIIGKAKPRNSGHSRKCVWNQFEQFCKERGYRLARETPTQQIANILKDWGFNMRKSNGEEYKEYTVKTMWNVVAKIIQETYFNEHKRFFNPFSDHEFKCARNARNAKRKQLQQIPEKRRTKMKQRRALLESQTIQQEMGDTEDRAVNHETEVNFEKQTEHISIDENKDGDLIIDEECITEKKLKKEIHSAHICRLCASTTEDTIPIFENGQTNHALLQMIHTYLPITITAGDLLPTTVCRECVYKLEVCHRLIQGCLDADSVLRTMFGLQNSNQVQCNDKNAANKQYSTFRSGRDAINNFLEENTSYDEYNYTNLADVKFEVESNDDDDDLEKKTSNEMDDVKFNVQNNDTIQNSNTDTLDTRIVEESAIHMQNVNNEPNLINVTKKERRTPELELQRAVNIVTNEAELQKDSKLKINANVDPQCSNLMPIERDKVREMHSVGNYVVISHVDISKYKDEDIGHVHKRTS